MTIFKSIFWFFMILLLLTLGIYVAGLILILIPFALLFMSIYYYMKFSKD